MNSGRHQIVRRSLETWTVLARFIPASVRWQRVYQSRHFRERLVIFTRYPEPGRAKTRLIPLLGAKGAAELQRRMTAHTLRWAQRLRDRRKLSIEVRFEGGNRQLMRERFGIGVDYRPQGEGDLGQRMSGAFREAFQEGTRRVVIVGSDCPALSVDHAGDAFQALRDHDLVLGPARDGGYYLIGLRRPIPEILTGIAWGTDEVLQATLRIAQRLQLGVKLLEPLADIDRPEDLASYKQESGHPAVHQRISVVIPVLNDAGNLARAIHHLSDIDGVEVIVADGGSRDETLRIAESHGAKMITSPPGRARQMNAGAAAASGDILLFLHADTRLPDGFADVVRQVLNKPGIAGGAFRVCIEAPGWGLRIVERLVNWRSRLLQLPYGDQGIFLKADMFGRIGGYSDVALMEDVELVRRLWREGKIAIVETAAVTSARRWLALGIWRTTLVNQMCLWAYWLGVSPARIARWYYRERGPSDPQRRNDALSRGAEQHQWAAQDSNL